MHTEAWIQGHWDRSGHRAGDRRMYAFITYASPLISARLEDGTRMSCNSTDNQQVGQFFLAMLNQGVDEIEIRDELRHQDKMRQATAAIRELQDELARIFPQPKSRIIRKVCPDAQTIKPITWRGLFGPYTPDCVVEQTPDCDWVIARVQGEDHRILWNFESEASAWLVFSLWQKGG